MTFYLDTSVLVPLYVDEPLSTSLHQWLANVGTRVGVSDLAAAEFCSAVSRHVRKGSLGPDSAKRVTEGFDDWSRDAAERIENTPADIRNAALLVRQPFPKLLTPDAIHLSTCQRLGATLVTNDKDMMEHAGLVEISLLVPV